ncbi:hypothetical protein AB0F92_15860 [Kitasatospora aureofaciens]|uniref:hypothetical protein n=1 Tax=Kitasatospora aureofaciens TaxID=1894 RepID=UPI0004C1105E|nr:hypothetical protein CP971_21345 [Streptomyces viridifaciens]UKZ07857.1 hypothetical protein BOQ63_028265 [Streptomyces viridifaciens]
MSNGAVLVLIGFLALATFLLVRAGELKVWQVLLIGVLAIYLDRIGWTDPIVYIVTWAVQGLTHTT